MMRAADLLVSAPAIEAALGSRFTVTRSGGAVPAIAAGDVIKSASRDSAYRHFDGRVALEDTERPIRVGCLSLVFDSRAKADHMFQQVAGAAHLSTQVDGCNVAVETVSGAGGLVSYWGYVQREEAMTIVTLDTTDPQQVSVADLRSLVTLVAVLLTA